MSFCKIKQVGNAALHWAQKHPTLVSTVVSIGVGVGCGAAIGWTGVGAVACGALAGAVGSAVSYGLECSAAGDCNAGDLAKQTVVGAVTGAIGGAIGGGAAGRLLGAAGKRIAAKALSRGAEDIAQDAAETVGAKVADGAEEAASSGATKGSTTVYRVEGAGNERVRIGANGNPLIRKANKPIFLNMGNRARAESFLQKRFDQGFGDTEIKSFDVRAEFVQRLRDNAVPESLAKDYPGNPLVVDTTKAADQYMLRPQHIKMMFDLYRPR